MTIPDDDSGQRDWRRLFLSAAPDWATTLRVAVLILPTTAAIWVSPFDTKVGPVRIGPR